MNSPLKFPLRVRIHGGECGAVARALHHEAQKVALTQNEQMFSSDVKGLMRQADRKKSLRSTLIERKQMSTKTSIKRIALVAVSALGFGLLSVMPANAAVPTTATLSVPTIVRASYTNVITITHAATGAGDTAKGIGLAVLQQPTGSSITLEASNAFTNGGTSAAIDFNPSVAGTYVVRAYVDETAAGVYLAGTDTLIGATTTITVVGAPASFTFGSTTVTTGPTGEKQVLVNVLDSNGSKTLLGSSFISLTVTDSTATTAAIVSAGSGGSGVLAQLTGTDDDIYIKDTDAGSTVTVKGLLNVAGTAEQTVTYKTAAVSALEPTDATLQAPTVGNFVATGSTALSRTYSASLAVTSFTAKVSGLTADAAFKAAIATSGSATVSIDTGANPVADANGVGTIVITATGASTSDTVTLTVDKSDTSSSPAGTIVITYSTPAAVFTSANTSPVGGNNAYFTAGSTEKTITATILDQYGQVVPGAYATASYTTVPSGVTGPTIASATTNASGVATLNTTLPSTVGTYVISVVAKNASGGTIGSTSAIKYIVTATGGPGALAISSGVNTATTFYAVTTDDNGNIAGTASAASYTTTQVTGDYTTIVVNVKDDAAAAVQYAAVTATPGAGVYVNSTNSGNMSGFNAASDLTIATDANGDATFYVVGTIVGTSSISFSVGTSSVSGSFFTVLHALDNAVGRVVTLDSATVANTSGAINQVTATVKDIWGNVVPGVSLTGTVTGAAGRLAGGSRTATVVTDAAGKSVFEVTSNNIESGTGTLTVSGVTATAGNGSIANILSGDLTGNLSTLTAAATSSATAAITVTLTDNATDAALEAIDAATAAEEAAFEAIAAADAATLAAEEAKAAAEAATTAIEELSSQVATLMAALQAQITTLANTVAKILKKLSK
jgi:hypothetical protein